jgi:hypothetical protein
MLTPQSVAVWITAIGDGAHDRDRAVLLGLAALGLIVFGVYGLCEARWRRVLSAVSCPAGLARMRPPGRLHAEAPGHRTEPQRV